MEILRHNIFAVNLKLGSGYAWKYNMQSSQTAKNQKYDNMSIIHEIIAAVDTSPERIEKINIIDFSPILY